MANYALTFLIKELNVSQNVSVTVLLLKSTAIELQTQIHESLYLLVCKSF